MTRDIETRNLVKVIESCLGEHEFRVVELGGLSGKDKEYTFSVIEVRGAGNLLDDFIKTYSPLDKFKTTLAKKVLPEKGKQSYGVLIDADLQYRFAFNRLFADLDRENRKIRFKTPEEVLLEFVNGPDAPTQLYLEVAEALKKNGDDEIDNKFIEQLGIFPKGDDDDLGSYVDDTVMRYAFIGGDRSKDRSVPENPSGLFKHNSLVDRVRQIYAGKEVDLKTDNGVEKFYLVKIKYETSTLDDFLNTFKDELDEFKKKLARKVFGEKKTENTYITVVNKDLKIVYAYNARFAEYDENSMDIIFNQVEDVLLEAGENVVDEKPTEVTRPIERPDEGRDDPRAKYGITMPPQIPRKPRGIDNIRTMYGITMPKPKRSQGIDEIQMMYGITFDDP